MKKKNNILFRTFDRYGLIILILYTILFCMISYYHEPWYDEAQAWQIGKTATYLEILTVVTHTEGHPPLWSLLLSVPAKLGVPYLIGLKGVSLFVSLVTISLIVFKSPFPKIIKYLLPFTYFLFYQYGVISRTYCVLELACILFAITFNNRNEKPWRFVGSLFLLCLTSAYGILIAGGICLCWIWEILLDFIQNNNMDKLARDKRIRSLIVLFILVMVIVYYILPTRNTYAADRSVFNNFLAKTVYFTLAMTGDSFISAGGIPLWNSLSAFDLYPGIFSSLAIWSFIFLISKKKQIKYYILPMLFFSVFMIYYGFDHHTGISFIYVISYTWAVYDKEFINKRMDFLAEHISKLIRPHKDTLKKAIGLIPLIFIMVSVFYCIETSVEEIVLPYSETAEVADFIKNHNLENAIIMIQWDPDLRNMTEEEAEETPDIEKYESESTFDAVPIISYFDNNIFFNHNIKNHDKGYSTHLKLSREENMETYKLWREYGVPEVLVEECCLPLVYEGEVSMQDYVHVKTCWGYYMGKQSGANKRARIYIRKDCLKKFGLDEM